MRDSRRTRRRERTQRDALANEFPRPIINYLELNRGDRCARAPSPRRASDLGKNFLVFLRSRMREIFYGDARNCNVARGVINNARAAPRTATLHCKTGRVGWAGRSGLTSLARFSPARSRVGFIGMLNCRPRRNSGLRNTGPHTFCRAFSDASELSGVPLPSAGAPRHSKPSLRLVSEEGEVIRKFTFLFIYYEKD